jgi:hypothetical protein
VSRFAGACDKEVFENEPSFPPAKGAAAHAAGYFAFVCRRGLYPHDLIKSAAVGTLEGRRLGVWHAFTCISVWGNLIPPIFAVAHQRGLIAMLLLELLQALHLVGLEPAVLLPPPIIGDLTHTDLADRVSDILTL